MAAGIDQVMGGAMATEHLLALGHQHVAHVTGPLDWLEASQRRSGWQEAHRRRSVVPGPEVNGDWSAHSGYDAGLWIADDPSVTAVFAANDAMALGVLKALHERGRRVPEEMSVVGFDDTPEAAYFWPALTTVSQDFERLGHQALDLTLRASRASPRRRRRWPSPSWSCAAPPRRRPEPTGRVALVLAFTRWSATCSARCPTAVKCTFSRSVGHPASSWAS